MEEYLNKKVLFKVDGQPLQEGIITETDPSKKAIKIAGQWYETKDVNVFSVLSNNINESGDNGEQLING